MFRSEDSRFRGGLRTTAVSGLLQAPKQLEEPFWEGSYLDGERDLVRILVFRKGYKPHNNPFLPIHTYLQSPPTPKP